MAAASELLLVSAASEPNTAIAAVPTTTVSTTAKSPTVSATTGSITGADAAVAAAAAVATAACVAMGWWRLDLERGSFERQLGDGQLDRRMEHAVQTD
jgi:hypothetical protein